MLYQDFLNQSNKAADHFFNAVLENHKQTSERLSAVEKDIRNHFETEVSEMRKNYSTLEKSVLERLDSQKSGLNNLFRITLENQLDLWKTGLKQYQEAQEQMIENFQSWSSQKSHGTKATTKN